MTQVTEPPYATIVALAPADGSRVWANSLPRALGLSSSVTSTNYRDYAMRASGTRVAVFSVLQRFLSLEATWIRLDNTSLQTVIDPHEQQVLSMPTGWSGQYAAGSQTLAIGLTGGVLVAVVDTGITSYTFDIPDVDSNNVIPPPFWQAQVRDQVRIHDDGTNEVHYRLTRVIPPSTQETFGEPYDGISQYTDENAIYDFRFSALWTGVYTVFGRASWQFPLGEIVVTTNAGLTTCDASGGVIDRTPEDITWVTRSGFVKSLNAGNTGRGMAWIIDDLICWGYIRVVDADYGYGYTGRTKQIRYVCVDPQSLSVVREFTWASANEIDPTWERALWHSAVSDGDGGFFVLTIGATGRQPSASSPDFEAGDQALRVYRVSGSGSILWTTTIAQCIRTKFFWAEGNTFGALSDEATHRLIRDDVGRLFLIGSWISDVSGIPRMAARLDPDTGAVLWEAPFTRQVSPTGRITYAVPQDAIAFNNLLYLCGPLGLAP